MRGALLLLVCLALFLPGLFVVPPVDRDEARFAQASRQMVASGDFVDIRFNDEPRYKKPVGIYWLQSAAVLISGAGAQAPIWVYRLPSLLGAVAAVLLTAWAGTRLFGASVGWLAGLMLAGSVLLGVEARLAKTDAVLLASVVLAQGALARLYLAAREGRAAPAGHAWLFWAAIGLGVLIKGPIILLVTGGTLLGLVAAERRVGWLRALRALPGAALALAMVLPWLVAITLQSDGAFWTAALGGDLLAKVGGGQESHGAPPGSYLAAFWLTFWPFALFAGLALPWIWRHRASPAVRFCLAWILPTWLVFELVPTKLPHYVLPVYPAIALLIAAALADGFPVASARLRRWLLWVPAGLVAAIALAFVVGGVAVPWYLEGAPLPQALAASAVAGGIAALVLGRAGTWPPGRLLAVLLFGAFTFYAIAWQAVIPRLESLWLSPRIAAAVAAAGCPSARLTAVGYSEPSLVFLVDGEVRFGDAAAAAEALTAPSDCSLALVEADDDTAFRQRLAEAGGAATALARIEGLNYSRGDRLALTLYQSGEPADAG